MNSAAQRKPRRSSAEACRKPNDRPRVCAAVFVERNERGYSFLNAQGSWSMVNLRGVERGNPDDATLRDRRAKMLLKGLAFACGGGALGNRALPRSRTRRGGKDGMPR